jgi:hypothetical protein
MERSDERLSTRDIASGTSTDTEAERDRDTALADPVDATADDTAAVADERRDRDFDERTAGTGAGAVAAGETPPGRGPSPEPADAPGDTRAQTGAASEPTPGAAAAVDDRESARADAGAATGRETTDAEDAPLLEGADEFQVRWEKIQVRFVDEPRGAVEDADALVATVMQRLAEGFASERETLEAQWGRGEDISTEDLRVALQRYRSFFRRLLAT